MWISKKMLLARIEQLEYINRCFEKYILRLDNRILDQMEKFKPCCICKKVDHIANMTELDMYTARDLEIIRSVPFNSDKTIQLHPECGNIVRSDDGKGWCRKKTHPQHGCNCENTTEGKK